MPSKPLVHRPPGTKSTAAVKRELDRERPSASRRGYGPRWRGARAAFLAQHPLYAACRAQGLVVPATVVDNVVPHRGDQTLFWGQSNWAPACKSCHDAKTAREGHDRYWCVARAARDHPVTACARAVTALIEQQLRSE